MDVKMRSRVEELYGHYTRSSEAAAKRKLFAALSELLTAHFTAEERALRGRLSLSLAEFRTNYLAARAFSELLKLDVGAPAFDARLAALCRQLGVLNDDAPPLWKRAA